MKASKKLNITEIYLKEASLDYFYFLLQEISFKQFYVHARDVVGLTFNLEI